MGIHSKRITRAAALCCLILRCAAADGQDPARGPGAFANLVFTAPAGTQYCRIDPHGVTVIPNGRVLTPRGRQVLIEPHPYGMALSPDGRILITANSGTEPFSFSILREPFSSNPVLASVPEGVKTDKGVLNACFMGLPFPPFAYLSKEMIHGTTVNGVIVPGLGDPNVPDAVSVYAIDIRDRDHGQVVQRIKTGVQVGQKVEGIPALGGASPNSTVCGKKHVYVSNGNNDSITVVDITTNRISQEIKLCLTGPLQKLRGIIPFGLALSHDGKRLYVAEAGINAVGVIDTATHEVLGHIPVGWFPSKVAVSPDDKCLVVANAKGFGAGRNGGPGVDLGGRSGIGNLMRGTVSILRIPHDSQLSGETAQVIQNNVCMGVARPWETKERNPVPPYPGAYESPIKYTVFIAKENRTYDQVFGELEGGRGEPSLADFGRDATVQSHSRKGDVLEHVNVMPNHQILARRFACSDNFYCDSDHSADGHRWLQGVYPGVFCETSTSASYGGRRRHLTESTAPGRRAVTGSAAGLIPEDYLEVGTLWDHFDRCRVSFYNFGLGFEMPEVEEKGGADFKFTGIRIASNYPLPAPLFERTSRRFATYNTNIPDPFRVDMFRRDMEELWLSGKEPFPRIITMSLPNDHGAEERPKEGYPYFASYRADNDLALGRVIELLSHTPYWRQMAVFVTEDDAQNGRDHVDHHRSLCLVIGPYARAGHVSHVHVSIPSIVKTINLIQGMPYINQYDAVASDLSDLFQVTPNPVPYHVASVHPKLFDPNAAYDPLDEKFNWQKVNDYPALDDPEVMRRWMDQDAERRRRHE